MRFLVLVSDGMADKKIAILGNRTPMEAARLPYLNKLARTAHIGTVLNVPEPAISIMLLLSDSGSAPRAFNIRAEILPFSEISPKSRCSEPI